MPNPFLLVTKECPRCKGEGTLPDKQTDGLLDMVCPTCLGEGEVAIEEAADEN